MAIENNSGDWYFIYSSFGQEEKVKEALDKRVSSLGLGHMIFSSHVLTREVIEMRNGERCKVRQKMFPGYILVNMTLNDDTWHAVKGTPGVIGFVGPEGRPEKLDSDEVQRLLHQDEVDLPEEPLFTVGMKVTVKEGPFAEMSGEVIEVHPAKHVLRVSLSMFARDIPVELGFGQVMPS